MVTMYCKKLLLAEIKFRSSVENYLNDKKFQCSTRICYLSYQENHSLIFTFFGLMSSACDKLYWGLKDVLIFSKLNHSDLKSVLCLPSNGCQKLRFSEILKT